MFRGLVYSAYDYSDARLTRTVTQLVSRSQKEPTGYRRIHCTGTTIQMH